MDKKYESFKEFYPFYLGQHQNVTCRVLHFVGTSLFFFIFFGAFIFHEIRLLILCPVLAYGFAWVGHYFFEKNKPATFKYPFYSLLADFLLYFEILAGKQRFNA
jgi:hypothetical protein